MRPWFLRKITQFSLYTVKEFHSAHYHSQPSWNFDVVLTQITAILWLYWRSSLTFCASHMCKACARQSYVQATQFNPLAHNDVYIRRTAQLTSRRCILNIYSTNILIEYFKHAAHSPFFSLQDAVYFIMLSFFGSCNIRILNTGCAKILKKVPAPKG